jgi:2-amino-4-hydroxy-6-hydroxymethyldihydropteridine diphosphokinase
VAEEGQRYLIALGSNQRHVRLGAPARVLTAALAALGEGPCRVEATSRIADTAPLGPSRRRFANAAAVVSTDYDPEAMLAHCQAIERRFGRRRRGQGWGPRVLDLDLVLWDGGAWASEGLTIPHPQFRSRDFVLRPAKAISPDWRDPITGWTLRQLHASLTRPRPARN